MPSDRFTADKATLRAELEQRARRRQPITYGEAGHLVGRPAGRLGAILAAIRFEKAEHGRPDLGALVVAMSTSLPSHVKADPDSRARAIAVQEAVFAAWATRSEIKKL